MTVLANFFSAKLRILNNSNWILQKINFKNWLVCITENNCLSIQQDLSWNWTWACSFKQKAQRMPGQTFRCVSCAGASAVNLRLKVFLFHLIFFYVYLPHLQHFPCKSSWLCCLALDCSDHSGHMTYIHTSCCNTVALWSAQCGVFMRHEVLIRLHQDCRLVSCCMSVTQFEAFQTLVALKQDQYCSRASLKCLRHS